LLRPIYHVAQTFEFKPEHTKKPVKFLVPTHKDWFNKAEPIKVQLVSHREEGAVIEPTIYFGAPCVIISFPLGKFCISGWGRVTVQEIIDRPRDILARASIAFCLSDQILNQSETAIKMRPIKTATGPNHGPGGL
jgi:hypothetical protein